MPSRICGWHPRKEGSGGITESVPLIPMRELSQVCVVRCLKSWAELNFFFKISKRRSWMVHFWDSKNLRLLFTKLNDTTICKSGKTIYTYITTSTYNHVTSVWMHKIDQLTIIFFWYLFIAIVHWQRLRNVAKRSSSFVKQLNKQKFKKFEKRLWEKAGRKLLKIKNYLSVCSFCFLIVFNTILK